MFWIDANTKITAEQSFVRIAHVCGLEDTDMNSVRHWLANVERSWFLILDNCDDDTIDYAQYFPPSQRGSIIFTTRLVKYQQLGKTQNLDILDRKDAVALILKACGLKSVSRARQKSYAEEVVTLLQQHVLALALAGSFVNKGYCTLEQYPDFFRRQQRRMMPEKFDQSYGDVHLTFETAAAALQESGAREDRLALELLGVLSFFHHEDIQQEIFVRALKSCKSVEHDMQQEYEPDDYTERNTPRWKSRLQKFARGRSSVQSRTLKLISYSEAIEGEIDQVCLWHCQQVFSVIGQDSLEDYLTSRARLSQLSLLNLDKESGTISIHPLVHSWARERLSTSGRDSSWEKAASLLAFSTGLKMEPETYMTDLYPHIQQCYHYWPQRPLSCEIPLNTGRILYYFASQFLINSSWTEAQKILHLLGERCKLDESTRCFRTKLLLRGEAMCLVDEHPDQAIKLGWQVIQAREAFLPEDDPDVLDAKWQVAYAYVCHDRHREAIPMLKRLIKTMSRSLEPDDWIFLSAQHYLGVAYNCAEKNNKAIAVLGPLAVVRTSFLGRKHKDRLSTMNVLACAYQGYGRFEKAIEIWEEIASLESDLPANVKRKGDIFRLATAYTDTGDTENATRVLEQWLSVRRKDGPLDDEDTRDHINLLGQLYYGSGRYEAAIKLLQELVDVEARLLPSEDEDRQLNIHTLACAYQAHGETVKAMQLWQHLLDIAFSEEARSLFLKSMTAVHPQLGYYNGYMRSARKPPSKWRDGSKLLRGLGLFS